MVSSSFKIFLKKLLGTEKLNSFRCQENDQDGAATEAADFTVVASSNDV